MKTTLYINPLDLQRAVGFTATEKHDRPTLQHIEIEYAPLVIDEALGKTALGKSKLRATDSFRMIEVETDIDTGSNESLTEPSRWYLDRLDALAAISKARIKKFPYAICEVSSEVVGIFPRVVEMWEKPATGLTTISFNSKLLADSIKALKCQNIRLEFAGNGERVLLAPDNSRVRALIMPIRTEI